MSKVKCIQELGCPSKIISMFIKSTKVFTQNGYIPHLIIKIGTSTNFALVFILAIKTIQNY